MNEAEDVASIVWRGMTALVTEHNDRRKEVCDALDLSFVRIKALRRVAKQPLTMRDLAAKLQTDAPYTTLVVDDLERRGLVRREPHQADRRAKLVVATDAGHATARRAEQILGDPPPAFRAVPQEELQLLARIIEKLLP